MSLIRPVVLDAFPFYCDSPLAVREAMEATVQETLLPAGEFFYRAWDLCPHFAVVLSGDLRVYKSGAMGRELTLYHVQDGQPCPMNLLCATLRRPAMVEAQAEVDTSALLLPGGLLNGWMAASEPLRNFVFTAIAGRLADVMTLVDEIAFQRMDARLAALLLKRFEPAQEFAATHEELAAELGTAREVVSRLLREFARRGAIRVTRGRIELIDREPLRHLM